MFYRNENRRWVTKGRNWGGGKAFEGSSTRREHVLRQGSIHKGETSSSSFLPFPFSLYHFSFSRTQVRYFIIGTIRPLSWIIPRADKVVEYRRGCSIFLPWASRRWDFPSQLNTINLFLMIPLKDDSIFIKIIPFMLGVTKIKLQHFLK